MSEGEEGPVEAPVDSEGIAATRPVTIAEKLDRLWGTMTPKGRPPTYMQVADAINAKAEETGVRISHATIWQLRTGKNTDPRLSHLQALADYFGVPLGYFTDAKVAERVEADLDMLAAMRDSGVRQVALRAAGLSPRSLKAIKAMIDAVQQLDDEAPTSEPATGETTTAQESDGSPSN